MSLSGPSKARDRAPALAQRLEWLRLRAAGERLHIVVARQELRQRAADLRAGSGWTKWLARIVLPGPGGSESQNAAAWVPLVLSLAPVVFSALSAMRNRRRGRRRGGGAVLGVVGTALGLAMVLRRYLRRSAPRS